MQRSTLAAIALLAFVGTAWCGDRQNWTGNMPDGYIYTGWRQLFGCFSLAFENAAESLGNWNAPCPIYDFPLFSNHVEVIDTDLSNKYINAGEFGGDAKPTYAVRPTDLIDIQVRTTHCTPTKRSDIASILVEATLRLKRDVQPHLAGPLYPIIWSVPQTSNALILPGRPPDTFSSVYTEDPQTHRGKWEKGNPASDAIDNLPVGTYVGGLIPLTEGLSLRGRQVGFPAPSPDALLLPKGTTWSVRYILLGGKPFRWSDRSQPAPLDPNAEQALAEMGFRGQPPFALKLTQGKLDRLPRPLASSRCPADLAAQDGGVAGRCENPKGQELLFFVPLRIHGLNPRCATALWRSDADRLDYFARLGDTGYLAFNADKTVDFYAGNVAVCDPALFVSVVIWSPNEAWFRLNNPTRHDVTTDFATAPAIKGLKPLRKTVTVKAGTSLDLKE